ncbi:MAG TPA: DsbA family protein, partial [Chloroflexota bacterium]|nr:DsbA family protein [Chloroflexota bacterium]
MTNLTFYFDPRCPWAWKTSLWAREVQRQGAITLNWKLFSLREINRDQVPPPTEADAALRALWLARKEGGQEAIDRLYLALGRASHDRQADLRSHDVLIAAAAQAELDPTLVDRAVADPATSKAVLEEHHDAEQRLQAFGVPWLVVEDQDFGFYGPIVDEVPEGQAALDLWEHSSWLLRQPHF